MPVILLILAHLSAVMLGSGNDDSRSTHPDSGSGAVAYP
jgi:hypothetical protein